MNYQSYYDNQIGGGGGRHYKIFAGAPHQKGHGIGSFLGGLFRRVVPLIKNGAETLGREALSTGMNVAADVALRRIPFKESLKTRMHESTGNLKRKADDKIDSMMMMSGSGYKRIKSSKKVHSRGRVSKRRTSKSKKKKQIVKRKKPGKSKEKKKIFESCRKNKKKKKKNKLRTVADIFS